jgi:hypothetical protein
LFVPFKNDVEFIVWIADVFFTFGPYWGLPRVAGVDFALDLAFRQAKQLAKPIDG